MTTQQFLRTLWIVAILAGTATYVWPHSGGRDIYGCHNNSSLQIYECHTGQFAGRSWPNPGGKDAMLRELNPPVEDPQIAQLKIQIAALQAQINILQAEKQTVQTALDFANAEIVVLKAEIARLTTNRTATLTWQPSPSSDVGSQKVYVGTASRVYGLPIIIGLETSYTVGNLTVGTTYYFAVTALDGAGNESRFSNEVNITIL